MIDRIAFLTYETPYSPCGGIAAVMKFLPAAVQRRARRPTIVISPCHYRLPTTAKILPRMDCMGSVRVPYDGRQIDVRVMRYLDDWSWYFLLPDDPRFFSGRRHPYDVGETGEEIGINLQRDSLIFGAAAAKALHLLAPGSRWAVLMQDWEAATAALAMAEELHSHELRLTLHNSYDCDVLDATLPRFGIDPATCPGTSVLRRALELVDEPVFTVSRQFALDIMSDPLQTEIIAPHLQEVFQIQPLQGVDNGQFVELAVPEQSIKLALLGRHEGLHKWKTMRRQEFGEALEKLRAAQKANRDFPWGGRQPPWGNLESFCDKFDPTDQTPWFVMGGRDDSRQKGYDIAARAVRQMLEAGSDARFLFFPIPGDEDAPGLLFLKKLAESEPFDRQVLVFPFRFRDGFTAALQGASFGLMPSLYEPFGAANEFYLNGTVGIGRATGGIVQQIVPQRKSGAFTTAVAERSNRWHGSATPATGFLFREPDGLPSLAADWQSISAGAYRKDGRWPDRVEQRSQLVLFREMADGLKRAMVDAAQLFKQDPPQYYKMLATGIQHIRQTFSWEKAADEYVSSFRP